jgi:uncharacterized OB-fold protein
VTKIAANPEPASADPRFVAPDLVRVDERGQPHLVGGRCRNCDAFSFPRAAVCTSCLSEDIAAIDLGHEGSLYSYSIVHQAPRGWATPYALGYVDLPGDVRVLAHIDVPQGEIAIDMPVRLAVGVVGRDETGAPLMSYTFTGR